MSPLDPHTPVIVGVAQINRRVPHDRDAVDLMADAVRLAFQDAGAPGMAEFVDLVAVLDGLWSWKDPGQLVAGHIGAANASTCLTTFGGQTPQALAGSVFERIAQGELGCAVITGGEINHTRRRAQLDGLALPRQPEPDGAMPDEIFGDPLDMGTDHEAQLGLVHPAHSYAVVETMLMAESGLSVDQHLNAISEVWAGLGSAAAGNPHAAVRTEPSAEEIAAPTAANRWVAWPYTKALVANNDVDMSAAVVICSAELAERLGISRDRWVFSHAATTGQETTGLTDRYLLHESPSLGESGRAVLELAGVESDDIDYFELYACFPAVVEMTIDALGIDPARPLSVSGGLAFAGAPMNTSTLHGLCAVVDRLRAEPDSLGLVQGNGGHIAKHAFGVYGASPPEARYRRRSLDTAPNGPARPVAPPNPTGEGTIEGYTVLHDRSGPHTALVATRLADHSRGWGTSTDPNVFDHLMSDVRVGGRIALHEGEAKL